MEYINISQQKFYTGKVLRFSSEADKTTNPSNVLSDSGFWRTEKREVALNDYLILDFDKQIFADYIEIHPSKNGKNAFPKGFRIEYSNDSDTWTVLITEKDFELDENFYSIQFPLVMARYIKLFIINHSEVNSKYFSEIGKFMFGIRGLAEVSASSNENQTSPANLFDGDIKTYWESSRRQATGKEHVLIDLGNIYNLNRILLASSTNGFPENFHIDISSDNDVWSTIIEEKSFRAENLKKYTWNIDLLQAQYIRIEAKTVKHMQGGYSVKLSGIEISAAPFETFHSHNLGENVMPATIFQAGIVRFAKDGESLYGRAVQSSDSRLRDATTLFKGIVQFAEETESKSGLALQASDPRIQPALESKYGIVRLANDMENSAGCAVQGNDSRLSHATESNYGIVKICPDGIDTDAGVVTGSDRRLQKASTDKFGICRLAPDGDDTPGAVVQANDKRLRDATTSTKGIIILARDGEVKQGHAVQSDDKRLKDASTIQKGIVELADDGEIKPGSVVQSTDRRLKDATTTSKGIVELAEDGEDKPGAVVQGNDKRLKDATEHTKGILRFASDGEESQNSAVQGSDKRLRDATTTSKGIVELAEDGEDKPGAVVQGNDKRLKDATEHTKGIVRFAPNGDTSPLSAVQGNDSRLKHATEDAPGILSFAKNNETKPMAAVQSNDARLSDDRNPLPHTHDYAPISHDLNSHTGHLTVDGEKNEIVSGITTPSDRSAMICSRNRSSSDGSIGIAGIAGAEGDGKSYGVFGHSGHIGIRGQATSSGHGCGVLGVSRFSPGGVFSSEHDYSLVVDGYGDLNSCDDTLNLKGNGDAIKVKGNSEFNGKISLNCKNTDGLPANITEIFEIDGSEYVSPGDILVVSQEGKSILSKSRSEYSRAVIGVVSGNPAFIINNSGASEKIYPVAVAGKALCRIDARNNPINPGDVIVASGTPGCGMKGNIDSFDKIGTVIGKALDRLENGIGTIPIFICHQ